MPGALSWLDDLTITRKGDGPPLLLLHGGSGPLEGMPFWSDLTRDFDVIAPTHPGFAATPSPYDCDTVDDLAYLYLDLMDRLDIRDAVLMGFSIGGWIAAEIAVKSTARLSRMILVDAVGIKVGDRETRDIADVFIHSPAVLAEKLYHDPSKAPDLSAMSQEEQHKAAYNQQSLALYGWEPYLHNPKLKGRLHRVDIPTLLIWGGSDGIVTPAYGAAYCDFIPGARMVVIDEAGHSPQFEQPEKFVDQVRGFARES